MKLLSVDPSDRGSQRCRMGPGLMSALSLSLGSPLLVSVAGGSCLCTAWPRPDLSEGFLQLDLKCCSPSLISHPPTQLILNTGEFTPILCPKLKGVKISVVVQSVDFKKHTPPRLVHELVKDMLKGLYVHTKFVINLEDFDTDIRYVVIEDIKLDSAMAGLITSKTSVEITSIQTVQHFRSQMPDQFVVPLGGLEGVSILLYLAGAHVQCIFCLPRVFEFFFLFYISGQCLPKRGAAAAPPLSRHIDFSWCDVSQRGTPCWASRCGQDSACAQSGG